MKPWVLAIDQGTTGSRAVLMDASGRVVASAYQEFRQYYPKPGWVEHDAEEIWKSCVNVIREALRRSGGGADRIAGIGITNQRETTVVWDRKTSRPVSRAIVWQCRRTAEMCREKRFQSLRPVLRRKTGLVLDPYFSGTKIKWMLDHVPGVRSRALKGDLCFGTIDSWLIWKLTGGQSHATDVTNASRTLIFNIRSLAWDKELLKAFGIPVSLLPQVRNSGSIFGCTARAAGLPDGIPITGVLGDQQAALYGQGCFEPGSVKNTYGTGCFLVLNTGRKPVYSKKGLLTTLASDDLGRPVYALEGSVFVAGAVVQWLRDELRVIPSSADSEKAAAGLVDSNGVYFVPAFTGLGAPYWDAEARGIISGLTRGANVRHIIRAALESVAYQTKDVFDLMQEEYGRRISELNVDGGACQNNFLMQFQADMLNCRIVRPAMVESTARGAALLAGVTAGVWAGKEALSRLVRPDKVFAPRMSPTVRQRLYDGWKKAVRQARSR
ncbi:MAG: glycerol kinase GlpK [Candidatus Omnitrophota bacterium]|nr:glycerol kinase GlpK [Candidatus Omnitrophota bacterium]MDZ4242022.1 glycerol kinase GlpK [Candidatus Omnitrophota bacterium]